MSTYTRETERCFHCGKTKEVHLHYANNLIQCKGIDRFAEYLPISEHYAKANAMELLRAAEEVIKERAYGGPHYVKALQNLEAAISKSQPPKQ